MGKKISGTPKMIRLLNKDLIEGIIKQKGPITQPELAEITNLSLVTVNKTVVVLLEENKIKSNGMKESTGGRKAQTYVYNDELSYYIGLYFEKDAYIGVVSNSIGKIIYKEEYPARTFEYELMMQDTFSAIDQLIVKCEQHDIAAIGIGVPGVVHRGVISEIPFIPCWEGKQIGYVLYDKYRMPILLENDVNLAVIGLYRAKYKNRVNNMALIYLENGIGAGLIINGELYSGSTNFAGELSFLTIDGRGEKFMHKKYNGNFEQRIITMNELLEDIQTDEVKELLLDTVAEGMLSLVCILNPEIIVIKNRYIKKKDIDVMTKKMGEFIKSGNLPKLVSVADLTEYSIKGVIDMCLMETTSSYSISSRKGE